MLALWGHQHAFWTPNAARVPSGRRLSPPRDEPPYGADRQDEHSDDACHQHDACCDSVQSCHSQSPFRVSPNRALLMMGPADGQTMSTLGGPQPPKVSERLSFYLDPGGMVMDKLESEATYESIDVTGLDLSGQHATMVTISKSHLSKASFARTCLQRLDLTKVKLDECDLANAVWERARLDKLKINGCRLTGLNLSNAHVREAVFQSCEASFSNFRSVSFRKSRFVNCNLKGADFQDADLRHVVFENCNLREAQMSFAKLEGTDFRGSEIDDLRVGMDSLRGAIVDPLQAAYLSGLMGLKVVY
ncbi:MAG: pentapeptide repeat-containing protein [Holophagaceae bacterium]|nr:pentapeptide repeat-containing protein [Holophagaceae bacterium]